MQKTRGKSIALAVIMLVYTIFIAFNVETVSADHEMEPPTQKEDDLIYVPKFKQVYEDYQQNYETVKAENERVRKRQEEELRLKKLKEQQIINNAINYPVCDTNATFKSMMDYRAITDNTSKQYKLIYSNWNIVSFNEYGQMLIGNDLVVAMGNMYGDIGDRFIISYSNGNSINVIKGDSKGNRCTHGDGSMIEHLVKTELVPQYYRSQGNFNYVPEYNGTITQIKRL